MNTFAHKYLQYSKRIAIFGITQWAVLACAALMMLALPYRLGFYVDEFAVRIINNVITCSSALAIAICSGYYAHSAYDNGLKRKIEEAIAGSAINEDSASEGNG